MAITAAYAAGDERSFENAVIEFDEDPTGTPDWNAIESFVGDLTVSGGDTPTSTYKTVTNNVIFVGEKNEITIEGEGLYTEETDGAFYNMWQAYEANGGVAREIRWSDSGSTGDLRFYTTGGKLTYVGLPTPTPNNPRVKTFPFRIVASLISDEAIA